MRSEGRGIIIAVGVELSPILVSRFRRAGFDVSYERSLNDARDLLDDAIPAAIILGFSPGAGRLDEIRRLRETERLAFIQIVVVAREGDLSMGAVIEAGADEVIDARHDSTEGVDEQASRILARIGRAERLSSLAMLDPLTGLHNRRFMALRFPAEIARATRAGTRVAVAVVDLDEFKQINDLFGHAAGDRALVAFSQAIRSELRRYDIVCRFGGDEFVVLFPDCGSSGGCAALTQLQARRSWSVPGLPVVSFSAGLAEFPGDGRSWAELFETADDNVRRAKASGRGHTLQSDPTTNGGAGPGGGCVARGWH